MIYIVERQSCSSVDISSSGSREIDRLLKVVANEQAFIGDKIHGVRRSSEWNGQFLKKEIRKGPTVLRECLIALVIGGTRLIDLKRLWVTEARLELRTEQAEKDKAIEARELLTQRLLRISQEESPTQVRSAGKRKVEVQGRRW